MTLISIYSRTSCNRQFLCVLLSRTYGPIYGQNISKLKNRTCRCVKKEKRKISGVITNVVQVINVDRIVASLKYPVQ